VECIFTWYWLADLCSKQNIPFVLGHALYMKAIHGGKAKNDKIDAPKIAVLLRGGMLPMAYVYLRKPRYFSPELTQKDNDSWKNFHPNTARPKLYRYSLTNWDGPSITC
jgi:hypothetical protein